MLIASIAVAIFAYVFALHVVRAKPSMTRITPFRPSTLGPRPSALEAEGLPAKPPA